MMPSRLLLLLTLAAAAQASDLLPLKTGAYANPGEPCAEGGVLIRGGRSSIGSPVTDCTIDAISHKGAVYSFTGSCTDRQSGGTVADRGRIMVLGPTSFRWIGAGDGKPLVRCGSLPRDD